MNLGRGKAPGGGKEGLSRRTTAGGFGRFCKLGGGSVSGLWVGRRGEGCTSEGSFIQVACLWGTAAKAPGDAAAVLPITLGPVSDAFA